MFMCSRHAITQHLTVFLAAGQTGGTGLSGTAGLTGLLFLHCTEFTLMGLHLHDRF